MRTHQNKREALIIGKIFYSLGYNVKVARCNAPKECDDRHYDIIFGLDPNFVTMSQKNPQALKIYYATQVATKPPKFVFFVNDSSCRHFSYERYLENKLRENFDFEGTPIKLEYKNKND